MIIKSYNVHILLVRDASCSYNDNYSNIVIYNHLSVFAVCKKAGTEKRFTKIVHS